MDDIVWRTGVIAIKYSSIVRWDLRLYNNRFHSNNQPHSKIVEYLFIFFVGHWSHTAIFHLSNHRARFYKPIISKYPPSHSQDYRTCNSVRLDFSFSFFPMLWSKWLVHKNGHLSGGSNPRPLSSYPSALPLDLDFSIVDSLLHYFCSCNRSVIKSTTVECFFNIDPVLLTKNDDWWKLFNWKRQNLSPI